MLSALQPAVSQADPASVDIESLETICIIDKPYSHLRQDETAEQVVDLFAVVLPYYGSHFEEKEPLTLNPGDDGDQRHAVWHDRLLDEHIPDAGRSGKVAADARLCYQISLSRF